MSTKIDIAIGSPMQTRCLGVPSNRALPALSYFMVNSRVSSDGIILRARYKEMTNCIIHTNPIRESANVLNRQIRSLYTERGNDAGLLVWWLDPLNVKIGLRNTSTAESVLGLIRSTHFQLFENRQSVEHGCRWLHVGF